MRYNRKTQLKSWFYSWVVFLLAVPAVAVVSVPIVQAIEVIDPPPVPAGECTQSIATVIVMDVQIVWGSAQEAILVCQSLI